MSEKKPNKAARTATRGPGQLDATDRRILSELRNNARLTVSELAGRVNLSQSPCWTRVKRLEESGAIEQYVAVLDHKALGFANTFFVEITLDKHVSGVLDRFGQMLADTPEVLEVHLVTGEYDYLVKVVVADIEDFDRLLHERFYKIEGIRHTRTLLTLRTLKRSLSVDPMLV
ncbi:MAG TPA: Lrp/AsnC family transcriptional regulator [Devosiaceae bacterium]